MRIENRPTLIISEEERKAIDILSTSFGRLYNQNNAEELFDSIFGSGFPRITDFEDLANILIAIDETTKLEEE